MKSNIEKAKGQLEKGHNDKALVYAVIAVAEELAEIIRMAKDDMKDEEVTPVADVRGEDR